MPFPLSTTADSLDLSGEWRVELDPNDTGVKQHWFARELKATLVLPGSVQRAGLGNPVAVDTPWTGGIFDRSYFTAPQYAPYRAPGNIKIPFWLQPDSHYTGAAWYQKTISIPAAWTGRTVRLHLERPHWTTTVWLDDVPLGSNDALSVPHVYHLPDTVAPGDHRLTVRVDNRLRPDIGENSHSISDHTQGNWNGLVGRLELRVTARVWIDHVSVDAQVADRIVRVRGQLSRLGATPWPPTVTLTSSSAPGAASAAEVGPEGAFAGELALGSAAALWDEFSPALHTVRVSVEDKDAVETTFGFRTVSAVGRQLTLNGRPLFLRGTLDCAIFPATGHPPTDLPAWKRIFSVIQDHGLNHVRFHSWCPPEAAFVAADQLGLYLQIEVASWPNWSTTLGDGKPVDAWIEAETARILRTYGNHPSFLILCAGNEPAGEHHPAWLGGWVNRQKALDPRRLYTAGAGWPQVPENDFHIPPDPRIQHWEEGLASRINARPPETRTDYADYIRERPIPVVSHEIGQWCVYPNFAETTKYTGYLKPKNFEIFRETLEARGMLDQASAFLHASGKLQTLCYKEEIESALRTPQMGGFQLLGLQDFPGQGTALVGVLDPFWDEKGYVSPRAFRRFCNSTVPLARLEKRVFTVDEPLVADIEVTHFGGSPLTQQPVCWQLLDTSEQVVVEGELGRFDIPLGSAFRLGCVQVPLADLPVPARYRLTVTLPGTGFGNDWDLWVYPRSGDTTTPVAPSVTIVSRLDEAALEALEAGGCVWLRAGKSQVLPDPDKGSIALGFSSIFWNTAWTNGQAPHTLGILCDPRHPALNRFPTESHSNWQWWYPITHAAPMILDTLPRGVKPIVQVVDDWFMNRKLALVFEVRVGRGRLLVSSIDLAGAELDPVRRQLQASLLAYVGSPDFAPQVTVTGRDLSRLLKCHAAEN